MTQVIHGLPSNIMVTLATDPALMHMVERCLEEQEFVDQFIRLSGVGLPRPPRNALDAMVDNATGYRPDQYRKFFSEFIPFVHRAVYLPMKAQFERDSRSNNSGNSKKGEL
ncbi:hypothetical protein EGJ48_03605 [Pantoea dispersa]|uniref:hypothetical protein n=1 Tax=Pantoea dispersa TaxID=59814 RepID=UPI000F67B39D|nr:hypothetical protein [Pantoea dispersa]RRW77644.1 hypothetical protein EGJ48_03605 [Pantoea dispersa]